MANKKAIEDEITIPKFDPEKNKNKAKRSVLEKRNAQSKKVERPIDKNLKAISVNNIRFSSYHDRVVDYLNEDNAGKLLDSLKKQGLKNPITVRPVDNNGEDEIFYELVTGCRRLWGMIKLDIVMIDCLVISKTTSLFECFKINIADNIHNPPSDYERALAYSNMLSLIKGEQSIRNLSYEIGIERTTLGRFFKMLDTPIEVYNAISDVTAISKGDIGRLNDVAEGKWKEVKKELIAISDSIPMEGKKLVNHLITSIKIKPSKEKPIVTKKGMRLNPIKVNNGIANVAFKVPIGNYSNVNELLSDLEKQIESLFE